MSGGMSHHLVRFSRRVPLPTLKQGSTLSVQCSSKDKVALRIQSGWRDDGHVTLTQYFTDHGRTAVSTTATSSSQPVKVNDMDMFVSQQDDKVTSLGRAESHVSIRLQAQGETDTHPLVTLLESLDQSVANDGTTFELKDGDALTTAEFATTTATGAENGGVEEDENGVCCHVTVQVPEKINLICQLQDQGGGSIDVDSKIEGDVKLFTTNGPIRAKKLRGHTVELEAQGGEGLIYSSDLLEAEKLQISLPGGGRFRAKRIHGDTVDIKLASSSEQQQQSTAPALDDDDEGSLVDVSSMYVSGRGGADVSLEGSLQPSKRAVRIKSHHGPVLVNVMGAHTPTECLDTATLQKEAASKSISSGTSNSAGGPVYPMVELGSVNGSCEVSVSNIAGEKPSNDDDEWVACQVHFDSISPESVSLLNTERGNIGLTFDRKLEADLRLLSCLDEDEMEKTATMLADEDDPEQIKSAIFDTEQPNSEVAASRISIKTQAFTESQSFVSSDNTMHYTEGWVENKSHEPDSRFELKTRGETGLGKIRLDGAAYQALKHFSSPHGSSSEDEEEEVQVDATRPLIVAATTGKVSVETLSWLGAIARRYGLDEKGRDLGRQATRRGRVVLPADDE